MSRYSITAAEIRRIIGVSSTDISDADMNSIVNDAEYEVERILHTTFVPKKRVDIITNTDGSNVAMLRKTPILQLVSIQVGGETGTSVSPRYVDVYPESGKIVLSDSAEKTEFDDTKDNMNAIEYYFGKMEETDTDTYTTEYLYPNISSGTTFSVGTTTNIDTDNYIKIVGTGGHEEVTKVTGTSMANVTLTAKVSKRYGTGTRVVKMETPRMVTELIRTIAGIMAAIHMVGSTYTFATSYSIPEHSVTKGVPYPHFEKVLNRLTEKQNNLLKYLRPTPFVY